MMIPKAIRSLAVLFFLAAGICIAGAGTPAPASIKPVMLPVIPKTTVNLADFGGKG